MKKKWILITLVILLIMAFPNCSPPGGEKGGGIEDPTRSQQLAEEAFQALNDYINEVLHAADPARALNQGKLDDIEDTFQSSLSYDSDNALANLGMGLLSYTGVIFDQDLSEYVSTLNKLLHDYGSSLDMVLVGLFYNLGSLLDNVIFSGFSNINLPGSISIPATAQKELYISEIQQLIDDLFIPALQESISYFHKAAVNMNNGFTTFSIEDETVEIDEGDVYIFEALGYAVLYNLQFITTYDLALDDPDNPGTELEIDSNTFNDEAAAKNIIKHNLDNNPAFLDYRNGKKISTVQTSMAALCTCVENAFASILNENDDQVDDFIQKDNLNLPQSLLDDINSALDEMGITQDVTGIIDAATVAKDLVNGNQVITYTLNGITFKVNFANFFDNDAYNGVRDFLPEFDADLTPESGSWPDLSFGGFVTDENDAALSEEDMTTIIENLFI
jgi:hypothetical protein